MPYRSRKSFRSSGKRYRAAVAALPKEDQVQKDTLDVLKGFAEWIDKTLEQAETKTNDKLKAIQEAIQETNKEETKAAVDAAIANEMKTVSATIETWKKDVENKLESWIAGH